MRGAADPTDANAGEPVTEAAEVVDRDGQRAPMRVVVLGVAGSGKSSVGRRLAERLGTEFVDGDSLHSEANVAKMAAGTPLVDADRWPWLTANREVLRRSDRIVLACSGLRRDYRDHLRGGGDVRFVYLDLDPATAEERAASRRDHFMGSNMIASQFETLERPSADERDVLIVDATAEIDTVVRRTLAALDANRP